MTVFKKWTKTILWEHCLKTNVSMSQEVCGHSLYWSCREWPDRFHVEVLENVVASRNGCCLLLRVVLKITTWDLTFTPFFVTCLLHMLCRFKVEILTKFILYTFPLRSRSSITASSTRFSVLVSWRFISWVSTLGCTVRWNVFLKCFPAFKCLIKMMFCFLSLLKVCLVSCNMNNNKCFCGIVFFVIFCSCLYYKIYEHTLVINND